MLYRSFGSEISIICLSRGCPCILDKMFNLNNLKNRNNSFLIITHYQKLLDYVTPDYVHVMRDGSIVKSGDKSLALSLEEKGYDWIDG